MIYITLTGSFHPKNRERVTLLQVILDRNLLSDDHDLLIQQMKGGGRMSKPLVRLFAAGAVKGGLNKLASITPDT
jgi:hypothetical protein